MITAATVHQIHKVLRSCFRQAVKWEMMDKNPAIDATLPKYKAEEREIWTAEMLMQAIDACENKWLKVAFHLAFATTVRIGELLGLTWDCVDVSEEAIAENRAYIFINKQVERVSRNAVDELYAKEVILIFPSQRKNNKTVRLLKTPKTDTSERKVYIPKFLAQILVDIKKEQDELKDIQLPFLLKAFYISSLHLLLPRFPPAAVTRLLPVHQKQFLPARMQLQETWLTVLLFFLFFS